MGRARTSRIASVVRMTRSRSAADRPSTSSRCRCRQPTGWVSGATSTDGTAADGVRVDHETHPTGSAAGAVTFAGETLDLHHVLAVGLLEVDLDELLARGRDVLADVVGPDGQLAVAAIDEDREPDGLRPAEVDEGVHRGPDGPARVQDVVDEDDRATVDPRGQFRALDDGLLGDQRQVVAVEGDVEGADRDRRAFVLRDRRRDPTGQRDAAALDADQQEAIGAGLLLHDLVGQAHGRPADLIRGHDLTAAHRSFPASLGLVGGLTGPQAEGSMLRIPRRTPAVDRGSVDVHRDRGRARPGRAAADVEEVVLVEVDDATLLLRAVVVDDPLDAAAAAAQMITTVPRGSRIAVVPSS